MTNALCPTCCVDLIDVCQDIATKGESVVNCCEECTCKLKELINHVPMIPVEPADVA